MKTPFDGMKELAECFGTHNANQYLRAGWTLVKVSIKLPFNVKAIVGSGPYYVFGWMKKEDVKHPEGLEDPLAEFFAAADDGLDWFTRKDKGKPTE